MRHLCGLGVWDDAGWKEGHTRDNERAPINWAAYVKRSQINHNLDSDEEPEESEESEEGDNDSDHSDPESL